MPRRSPARDNKTYDIIHNSEWCSIRNQIHYTVNMYAHQGCIPVQPGWEPQQQQDTAGWTPHRRSYPPGAVPSPGMLWKPFKMLVTSVQPTILMSNFHYIVQSEFLRVPRCPHFKYSRLYNITQTLTINENKMKSWELLKEMADPFRVC